MKNGRAPKPAAELVAYLQESVALLIARLLLTSLLARVCNVMHGGDIAAQRVYILLHLIDRVIAPLPLLP